MLWKPGTSEARVGCDQVVLASVHAQKGPPTFTVCSRSKAKGRDPP